MRRLRRLSSGPLRSSTAISLALAPCGPDLYVSLCGTGNSVLVLRGRVRCGPLGRSSDWSAAIDPMRPHRENPEGQCRCRYSCRAGSWRRPRLTHPDHPREGDEGPKRPTASPVPCLRSSGVERNGRQEEAAFQQERCRNRVPKAKSHLWSTWPQRQVRPMCYEIQHPVTDHDHADQSGGARSLERYVCNTSARNSPNECHQQAMTPWVGLEGQRCEGGIARRDLDDFEARQKQEGPQ